jgi:Arc/MetJ-type ribon-helix-helix transcriptional regulator
MDGKTLLISIDEDLAEIVDKRIRQSARFDTADDYIRALIERDAETDEETRDWLAKELAPGLAAKETAFVEVSPEEVIRRNRARRPSSPCRDLLPAGGEKADVARTALHHPSPHRREEKVAAAG